MTAPNEHEIRDAIERYWHGKPGYGFPPAGAFSDGFSAGTTALDGLYDLEEFRASEESSLNECLGDVVGTLREETEATLLDRLTVAAVAWAQEHPDAPLRQREEVTA